MPEKNTRAALERALGIVNLPKIGQRAVSFLTVAALHPPSPGSVVLRYVSLAFEPSLIFGIREMYEIWSEIRSCLFIRGVLKCHVVLPHDIQRFVVEGSFMGTLLQLSLVNYYIYIGQVID